MKILYVTDGFTGLSVFRSQVHTLCQRHSKQSDIHLAIFARLPEFGDAMEPPCSYTWTKSLLLPKAFCPELNWLSAAVSGLKPYVQSADIMHCRGHVGTALGLQLRKWYNPSVKIIADIRGAIVQEIRGRSSLFSRLFSYQALRLERQIFSQPDWFFFVSEKMREYYHAQYNLSLGQSSVFPTIVDDELFQIDTVAREQIRSQLGWAGQFIYVYAGGVDYWQNVYRILVHFKEASEKQDNIRLMLLVTDSDLAQKMVEKVGINKRLVHVSHVPYESVGRYLNGADAGLLVRDDTFINHVASPTKGNEYRACGLKIINDPKDIGDIYAKGVADTGYMRLDSIVSEQQAVYHRLATSDVS